MPGGPAPSVFVSHTAADRGIADAISDAIDRLFKGKVTVTYSTKRGGEGAIQAGANWFTWIGAQVKQSHLTIVLLTPRSLAKEWLLWEAGAVYGAALVDGEQNGRSVRPLLYRLAVDQMPNPLRAANVQALRGDRSVDIEQFFTELIADIDVLADDQKVNAGRILTDVVKEYLAAIESALDQDESSTAADDVLRDHPLLSKAIALTIRSLQALRPEVRINGRYFFASSESDRDYLVRSDYLYHESEWMQEFALQRVDVELNGESLIICQSFLSRTPIYRVLTPDYADRYRPEVRPHIDPGQGWVLGCPVLPGAGKPVGVLCLYGKESPARDDDDVARLLQVVELLSDVFAETYKAMGV